MRFVPTFFLCFAAAVVSLVAGCHKSGRAADGANSLRISQRNEPTDLDPATASLPDEFFVIRSLSEGLLVPNPNGGAPLPAAADRYEVSPDGLTYTFHLRKGATWSNGEPVTAADFIASYHRLLSPATAAPKAYLFYAVKNAAAFVSGQIPDFAAVGLQAADAQTLVVTLAEPNANFPLYVASGAWIPVNPRVVTAHGRKWTQPANYVGNGPFTLAEWRPQQRIVVRRNPLYRGASHVRLAAIEFVRFDSGATEERAFRAGEVDVTLAVPQSKLEVYTREHPDELHRAPLAETRFISFNTTHPPLNDPRVRRALSLAIDRDQIITRVLQGGQQPADRFLSPTLLASGAERRGNPEVLGPAAIGHDPGGYLHTHNPSIAQQLLAEAGFPGGKGFPHLEFSGWDHNPTLEAVQQMWRQTLGIEVEIVVREAKVHLAALNTGDYDIAFVTNLLDVSDPVSALHDFTPDAPNNFPHWKSAEFAGLVAAAGTQIDASERHATILRAERLLLESAVVAPVYFNAQNWLMSPRVHGWEQDALWSRRYDDVRLEPKATTR